MSGFFKKLFHRLAGKGNLAEMTPEPGDTPEAPVAEEAERAVAPAPAPEEIVEIQAEDGAYEVEAPAPVKRPKAPARKTEARTPEAGTKKSEAKKAEPRKVEVKKAEAKKPEAQKPAPKKPEAKKPEPRKPEPKQPEPKKTAPRPEKKPRAVPVAEEPVEVDIAPPPAPTPEPEPELDVTISPPEADMVPPVAAQEPAPLPEPVPEAEAPARGGWFSRLREGLSKSSRSITGSITTIFTQRKLNAETLQELEDVLIQADLGLPVAERIIAEVSRGRFDKEIGADEVKAILAAEVAKVLRPVEIPFTFGEEKPYVILVVGVNGGGKTTTIGKLGSIATREGFKVMFAACDTFRAAAIEQLSVWGSRIGARTISRPTGADAAGLAFDALKEAQETGTDILFIDTAGRLQNKAHLMDELDKVVRVIKKRDQAAPHAVLLVLDATTGQNAMAQADIFTKVAGVTGIIMTKLDGTARGGILVAIADKFKLPVHAIGVGEKIDDLQPFDAEGFARAIAGLGEA
jgi:fused signal recognition particle receptor